MIIHGDCLDEMKRLADNSIDFICTDPPYGYSFMGKEWDKAVPGIEIWQECLRILKPGAFCCVMSAPRSDVQMHMIQNLTQAGFRLDFTPIYWTYASGFPKAGNIGKMVDKRLGAEREVVGQYARPDGSANRKAPNKAMANTVTPRIAGTKQEADLTAPATPQAKALDGSYAGFQPKPAVEVIIVAMKPLSEKTFVDQALKNGKGITWLDDCRVPSELPEGRTRHGGGVEFAEGASGFDTDTITTLPSGRFPANLLVSDDVLNDGKDHGVSGTAKLGKTIDATKHFENTNTYGGNIGKQWGKLINDNGGSYSRYFDLDKWAAALPFLIVPKASKSEKNKGLNKFVSIDIIEVCNDNGLTREGQLVRLQVDTDRLPLKATVVSGTQHKSVIEWSMSWFGSEYTEKYPLHSKSTTETTTSSITPSRILSWLAHSLTSENIADVSLETTAGGNPAENAESSNTLTLTISEKMALALGVGNAQSKAQLKISVKDGSNVHPTCKPLKLMSYLITLFSRPDDIVLDPFVGSGTTCLAAKKLDREYIGIEKEAEYVEIARGRISQAVQSQLLPM